MNTETKKHIDAARQVLVGVVPNPTSQIDQITNALIYKFMDDMDQAAIKQGGDPSFFIDDLKNYAWTRLMDARVGNQERMNIYQEALQKFSESKQLPLLFREIFKSAFLPYRSPEVLGLFLKEINYFDYSHPEELGNAYEYLLSVMGSQGDAGQFRTPRHIIDFMVDVVDPTMEDKVLDPACGTGGFLVSSFKHILEQHDGKNTDGTKNEEKPLTPDQKKTLMGNFEGYDIDPGMVRIAQVNMYLHQFKGPKIYNYDTLTMEDRWSDKFSVILANPPFMSPKGGVSTHSKFSISSSRSEVLFVDYIMNHLRPNGRAGIIVPEGIIFQSGASHKQLRKNLVEDGLYAVVSLPQGVFNPYAGVKTSILFFNNELAKKAKEILFVKVENDGFDLGATKRPINKNDLPEAIEILNKWKDGKKVESKLAVYVDKVKIAETGDYNLSVDRYRITTDYSNAKWPMVELGDICDVYQPKTITSKEIKESGKYKVYGANGVIGFFDKYNHEDSEVAVTCRGATCGTINFTEPQSWITGNAMIVKPKENTLNKLYLFYLLRNTDLSSVITGAAQPQITGAALKPFKIPLPPLEIQEQIVKDLDGYQNIITSAKQIVYSWKPVIKVDPKWDKVKLEEVLDTSSGGTPLKSKNEYYDGGTIPWITSGEVSQGLILKSKQFITKEGLKNSSAKKFPIDTVLVAMYGATIGQVGILGIEATTNQAVCGIFPDSKYIPKFLYYFLLQQKEDFVRLGAGGAQPNISQNIIRNLEIPNISIKIQEQIVDRIESERTLVEGNKKLIEIYEQKTKDALAKLWEE